MIDMDLLKPCLAPGATPPIRRTPEVEDTVAMIQGPSPKRGRMSKTLPVAGRR